MEGGKKNIVVVGPWGGNGGTIWDDGTYHGVREITLVYGNCIDSIRVVYDKNGKPITADKHGGDGGSWIAEIKLQFPEEFLISVSGHYYPFRGSLVIRSLAFKSNRRTFGPYGLEVGTPFTYSIDGGQIVGLKGRSGSYLDSLGFYQSVQSPTLFQKVKKGLQKLASKGGKKGIVVVGPWGGNGGTTWDDGTYHGVREITLVYGRCIDSIRVVYDKNGKPITADKHGGDGGSWTAEVN